MIAFSLYLLAFLLLIYFTGFFSLFKDANISSKQFTLLFFLKALAIPVFYFVYQKQYGGLEKFDTGKFYNDVKVIHDFALKDFGFYLRLMFGLQNDQPGSYDYQYCLVNTLNWDNGTMKDYLYNDNRILIRLHSLLQFVAFDSYAVQALFSCFFSFTGIYFLYKSLKEFFSGKEFFMLLVLCLLPALWFYTGALLKEGLTLLILGLSLFSLKSIIAGKRGLIWISGLVLLVLLNFLLKPYFLVFALICFGSFFWIRQNEKIKQKSMFFFSLLLISLLAANTVSLVVKKRSLWEAASKHQRIFSGVAKGGIYIYNNDRFIRLNYDSTLIYKAHAKKDLFKLKTGVSYMYWKTGHKEDTLYCRANSDTNTIYRLAYTISPAHSNINIVRFNNNPFMLLSSALYYTLLHPLFVNAHGTLQVLASFENLVLALALLFVLIRIFVSKKERFPVFVFMFFALALCLLFGLSTPNSGAIFRYRAPAVLFILLAALYYLPVPKSPFFKKFN